jgi:hypothetical protein
MAVTIDATNMQLIDLADATTGWTSSMGSIGTTNLGTREGGTALEDQASEETFEVYHTIASEDYTSRTIFGWQRSGGPDTETNDGFGMYLSDGTDSIAYSTGGSDNYGFFFQGWSMFRLNTADLPTNFRVLAGVEANLTITALTRVGYSGNFPAKAAGNSNNVAFDVLRYCSNSNPSLLIEGGTTGDRGTFAEIVTNDESTSNAWGIIRLLVPGSKAYEVNFGMQIGSLDSTAYFDDSDFQLLINGAIPDAGAGISAGSMDIDCVGHSASTNLCNFDNFFVQSLGAVSNWTMSTDLDTAIWTNGQFVDCGTFVFPVQDAGSKSLADIIFSNCGAVTPSSLDMDRVTFNGTTDANGAMIVDEDQHTTKGTQSELAFNSDGTGHGVNVNPTGSGPFSFDFDNWQFTGYGADDTTDAAVFINPVTLSADITINIQNGGTSPTRRLVGSYSGTLLIVNAVTVRVEGVTEGTAVKIIANETVGTITTGDVIFEQLANSSGVAEITSFNYEGAFNPSGLDVIVRAHSQGLPNAAIADDNAAYTDQTTAANSTTTADMTILPTTPVVNEDGYIFGHNEQFGGLKVDLSTAGVGGGTITWQYWNGAWTNLTGVVDESNSFANAGLSKITWTIPGDWVDTTINSQGPFRYVRARFTAGAFSTAPVGRLCTLDVRRYLPFTQNRTILSSGLTVVATWVEDTIAQF